MKTGLVMKFLKALVSVAVIGTICTTGAHAETRQEKKADLDAFVRCEYFLLKNTGAAVEKFKSTHKRSDLDDGFSAFLVGMTWEFAAMGEGASPEKIKQMLKSYEGRNPKERADDIRLCDRDGVKIIEKLSDARYKALFERSRDGFMNMARDVRVEIPFGFFEKFKTR